jgi:prenyltransferase/squalene oxidase-like repeat protein
VIKATLRRVRSVLRRPRLPEAAKAESKADRAGLPPTDPGIPRAIEEAVAWLCRAQDESRSHDGGVARHYSLIDGWSPSYPETTGYIIPTLLARARSSGDETLRRRAKRMCDWLVSLQFPEGGFPGGTVGAQPHVPVSFNTGQILLGLAAAVREFGDYQESLVRAADWLVKTQDPDGAWRRHPSPFAAPGEKTYDTHVAWGLLEAARVAPDKPYAEAALANVRWALSFQRDNGWLNRCCLADATQPLTHTIGYALRGIIEAYLFSNDESFLGAGLKTASGLLSALREDGRLPGRLDQSWRGTVPWVCLTGSAQIAICWLLLHQVTGEPRYLKAASAANAYVRRTVTVDGPPETRGAVKGSFPVDGDYGRYEYLNWACKFLVDANTLEDEVCRRRGVDRSRRGESELRTPSSRRG